MSSEQVDHDRSFKQKKGSNSQNAMKHCGVTLDTVLQFYIPTFIITHCRLKSMPPGPELLCTVSSH